MKIPSQKDNIPLDLNKVLRKTGLARLAKILSDSTKIEWTEVEFWSCLYLKETPFADITPRALLVGDSHIVPQFKKKQSYLDLNRKLQSFMPTLFVAQTSAALDRGALPGERTLHSPLFPSLHLKAIANAKCVVSFHMEPLLAAISNRVPAIFVGSKESEESQLAKQIGIPTVMGEDTSKLVAEIEMYFSHYSWKKIDEFCEKIKKDLGLPERIEEQNESHVSSELFNVCTITDSNYLPFFLGFIENVNQASAGNFKCHVLTLDPQAGNAIKKMRLASKIEVIPIQSLWSVEDWKNVSERSVGMRAFSTKPRLLSQVLRSVSGPVFYCDSDVFFFEEVRALQSVIGTDYVALFPHFNDEYPAAQLDGLYNAGMIAVAPGAEPFLDWWGELCLRKCDFDHARGFVGDQAYLNLAPILFEHIKVYKGRNHNVARWNSRTLKLDLDALNPEMPVIDDGKPVSTYHAAFADERGVYQMKYLWDHLVSFYSPVFSLGGSTALAQNVKFQQKVYWSFWDYVSKVDEMIRTPLIERVMGTGKYNTEWWFTEPGRASMRILISFKAILNQLKIRSNSSSVPIDSSVSTEWIDSNLKALQSSETRPSPESKVA